jgi:hypothetical protein
MSFNRLLRFAFSLLLTIVTNTIFAQDVEVLFSDLKSCTQFYWQATDIAKQIEKRHDTATYFHDGEIIIFFNQDETKRLSKNTFYIFNHGFNKLFSLKIAMIQIEASNNKKDKVIYTTTPEAYFNVFYQDSLARCNRMIAGPLEVNVPGYKKARVIALFVEIKYYNQQIFKWFLCQPDSLDNFTNIIWQKKTN